MICEYVGLKLSGCWYLYPFAKSVKKKKKRRGGRSVSITICGNKIRKREPSQIIWKGD